MSFISLCFTTATTWRYCSFERNFHGELNTKCLCVCCYSLFLFSSGIRGWNVQRILKYDKLSFFIKLLCVGLCITAYPVERFRIWLGQRINGPYQLAPGLGDFGSFLNSSWDKYFWQFFCFFKSFENKSYVNEPNFMRFPEIQKFAENFGCLTYEEPKKTEKIHITMGKLISPKSFLNAISVIFCKKIPTIPICSNGPKQSSPYSLSKGSPHNVQNNLIIFFKLKILKLLFPNYHIFEILSRFQTVKSDIPTACPRFSSDNYEN